METDVWGRDYRPGASDDMKQVHGIGLFYFVVHRNKPQHFIMRAGMREIDPPYRWGRGIEIRLLGRTLGVGLCRRKKFVHEYDAIREAMDGRDISENTTHMAPEIGDW